MYLYLLIYTITYKFISLFEYVTFYLSQDVYFSISAYILLRGFWKVQVRNVLKSWNINSAVKHT